MGNKFNQFVLGDPVLKRTTQVKGQLFGAVHGYQRTNRDNASVALGQAWALPYIAEQNLFGQIDQLRCNIAYPNPLLLGAVCHSSYILRTSIISRGQRRPLPKMYHYQNTREILASLVGHSLIWKFPPGGLGPHCGVEMWRGGLGSAYLWPTLSSAGASLASPCFRFHIPLIEPDVRICRIRLSEKTHAIAVAIACDAVCNF